MDIQFEIKQEKFQQAADKAPGVVLKNMRLAMLVSCRDVQRDARAKHLFRSRTGALEAAIDMNVTEGGDNGIEGSVYIDDSKAPYGKYVHPGTKPHIIRPKNKRALRWADSVETGGKEISRRIYMNLRTEGYQSDKVGFRFAKEVHHPGTKKDEFVYEAGERNRQHINDVFNRYADRAIKEAGL